MNESLKPNTLNIPTPSDFCFEECLAHLMRSEQETMHQVINYSIYKAIKLDDDEPILFIIEWKPDALHVRFFEALAWAIIGQQINLTFAYTLKKRLVEKYGDFVEYDGKRFYTFPSFEMVASLTTDDLRALQFSSRKAEYIIGIAQLMKGGKLDKDLLFKLETFEQKHLFLTTIRGIGPWTADYVLMKSLQEPSAFPISDVGLHNALKKQLNLDRKPTVVELKELAERWKGWQAYATFYLWRSL
ncbi:DNA-3-methyladenine glycosylase 2 family protein [Psychrobacillus sp. BL-248-WT-3]|uniref:DNA-3-methyladenine glycosylase family protein n=1 Tax=Psychrobacillus sp. BL-248-WT-3 TaxID=2725306 RepID=UPI00146F818C|nr:DNA-3-methyladenine glycosylase 2 family protein [Psychrobacillus sp. BL-248-WT-3]NME04490.1 DNA-3-methyladenine glycosylase 2 family protein [Psychrobacillus sp. BL-248-WT-3]